MVNEKPFKLDMPFKEALRCFARTDEREIDKRKKLKPKKKAGGRSPPAEVERPNSDRPSRGRQPKRSD
jgi:hypothetical protein